MKQAPHSAILATDAAGSSAYREDVGKSAHLANGLDLQVVAGYPMVKRNRPNRPSQKQRRARAARNDDDDDNDERRARAARTDSDDDDDDDHDPTDRADDHNRSARSTAPPIIRPLERPYFPCWGKGKGRGKSKMGKTGKSSKNRPRSPTRRVAAPPSEAYTP
eukprot:1428163-Amphidinium_carterae.1